MDSFTTASELHSSTTGSLHSSPDQVGVVPSKPNNLQSKNFFDDFVIVPMLAEVKTPEFSKNRVDVNETANELEEILEPVSSVNPQSNTLIQKLISTLSGFTSPATVLNNLIARLKSINSISNNRPLASASETIEQITKHLRKHYPAPICLGKLPSEVADQLLGALSLHLNAFWSQASWKENGKYWQKEYSTEVMPLTDHTTDDSPHVTFLYAFEKLMMHFSSAKLASSGTGLSMLIRALLPFVALSSSASNFSSRHYLIDNLYDDICDMEENVLELLGGQMFNLTGLIKTAFEQFEVIQRQDGKEVNFLAPKFSNFYPNDDEVKEQLLAALGNAIKKWTKLLPKNDGKIDEGLLLLMCHQSIVSFEDQGNLIRKSFHELATAKMIVETIVSYRGVEVWLDMKSVFGAAIASNENVDFHSLTIVKYIELIGYAFPSVKAAAKIKAAKNKEVDLWAKEKEEIKQKMMLALGLIKNK